MIFNKLPTRLLRVLQAVFYLGFVLLWFKDNFPALKPIPLSPLWAFIPLAAVTLFRLLSRIKAGKVSLPPDWRRDATALGIIVILVTLAHVPFLTHSFGLMDSDEAIPALMGKHIAEGLRPPLFFYGAFFQGSFPQHYMAAFFKLFGYSVFLAKLSALAAFLLFLGVQFFLLKKIFSFGFACAAGLFYVLPWHELVRASLDLGSGFPVVLGLGSLALYLTAGIAYEDKSKWVGTLGFILGLAFWSHQICVIFGVAIAPFLVYKFRADLKKYLESAVYFVIGAFPLILNEGFRGFPIVRVFFLGQPTGTTDLGSRIDRAKRYVLGLISTGPAAASGIYLLMIGAGLVTIIVLAARRKMRPAALIFPVFLAAFMGVYLLSRSSRSDVTRYLYILYIALPVLLAAPFFWLKPKARAAASAASFTLVFALSQAGAARTYYNDVKAYHEALTRAVAALTETGERFWISDFWTSYLVTSLSGEKLIVASHDVKRYYPYELRYWSEGRNNWLISKHREAQKIYASALPDILDGVGVGYERKDAGEFTLIYRIRQDIFPRIFLADPPKNLPDVRLIGISSGGGELRLEFAREDSRPSPGLGLDVEIPGYCFRFYPMWEQGRFTATLPFPPQGEDRIRYGFSYAGFRLEHSMREARWAPGPAELAQPRPEIEFLEGIGPQRDVEGRPMSACRKVAKLEVNVPRGRGTALAFDLYSPFDFREPWWYGDFSQSVTIFVNDQSCGERALGFGKNRVALKVEPPLFRGRGDVVRLEFKYAMPMAFSENFKTSAYLERIAFE